MTLISFGLWKRKGNFPLRLEAFNKPQPSAFYASSNSSLVFQISLPTGEKKKVLFDAMGTRLVKYFTLQIIVSNL